MAANYDLPPDIAACHALLLEMRRDVERIAALEATIAALEATIAAQQATIAQQQATIAAQEAAAAEYQASVERMATEIKLLKRMIFGRRRERYADDPRQGCLFSSEELSNPADAVHAADDSADAANGADDSADQQPPAERPADQTRRTSRGRRRRVFPEFLPREEVRHPLNEDEIPAELKNDPNAKRFWKKTGETLEYEPPKLTVKEHFQEVLARTNEAGETAIASASKPPRLVDAFVEPGFLAYLTAARFADHLPYYRLEDILSRYGFRIGRSTQWRWMQALAAGVAPLVDLMRRRALESLVLGVDETPVRMLSRTIAGSVKAYLWATAGDRDHPYDCFYFTTNRSQAGPEKFLADFRGYLQADAYVAYERIAFLREEVLKVSCWAHARRKFEEVHFTGPSARTHAALGYFQRLYDIEDRAKPLDDESRHELRRQEARPLVEALHAWVGEQYDRELPKSKLRGAIGYMLNRWDSFERYLEHGAIPIDNNRTEATLKYAVLGRKAWLFVGNEPAGQAAAALFTLTKSCNRHHIDPYAYLRDVYSRLPTIATAAELEALLPDRWLQEHPAHRIRQRADEAAQRAERTRRRRAARRRMSA